MLTHGDWHDFTLLISECKEVMKIYRDHLYGLNVILSYHHIVLYYTTEIELILNIINTLQILFLSLLDIVSNTNHEETCRTLIDQRDLYLALCFIGYLVDQEGMITM